jgi:hypothetical protein
MDRLEERIAPTLVGGSGHRVGSAPVATQGCLTQNVTCTLITCHGCHGK